MSKEYSEARRIANKYAVDEGQVLTMIRDEAVSSLHPGGSREYAQAIEDAAEALDNWLGGPEPAHHPANTDEYPRFLADHRRAYVWAAFTRDTFRDPPRES